MAAQELRAAKRAAGLIDNAAFGAAGVGDERFGAKAGADDAKRIEDAADGLREEDQIGAGNGLYQRASFVDGAAIERVPDGGRGTHAHHAAIEARGFQRQAERRANETGPDDDDGFHQGRAGAMVRLTAGAIVRSWDISSAN